MIIVCIAVASIVIYFCCTKCRHTCTIFKYCFPFLPISHIIHTSRRTDLFVEVTNITKGDGIWAHFASTRCFPSQICMLRPIQKEDVQIETFCCICRASARPPAFLPTTPHIPSRLEGKRVSFLNGAVHLGRNLTQAVDSGLSQSEAFLPLSLDHSDIARERDVMLPIKGKCMQMLGALRSDLWLWILGLS